MAEDDWRRRSDSHTEPELSRNLALRDALRPIAARHGTTVSAVAVAWALAWPGVSGAIVGARNAEQVDGWLPAARWCCRPPTWTRSRRQSAAGVGRSRSAA
jgi:aryl-alcohol dehydrogenase-like predicted oxidoreductase